MVFAVLLAAVQSLGLGAFSAQAREQFAARIASSLESETESVRVAGTVTGVGDSAFFIQLDDEALKVWLSGTACPRPGDTVEVEGHPALEGGRVLVSAKTYRKTGSRPLPVPCKAGYADLLNPGDAAHGHKGVNWMRVEVTGRAFERTETGFAVDVEGIPVTVLAADVPPFIRDCGHTRPLVKVCGVAELVLDQSALFGRTPYVMGVKLQINAPDDVTLVPDALYLVNVRDRRMMLAVVAAFVLLGAGLIVLGVVLVRQQRRSFRTRTLMAERKRMADDIHDTIEQHLVGAGMLIQLNRNKEAREILVRAKRELRDVIWGLKNDDMMRKSPAEMLRELAETEMRSGLFQVSVKLEGLPAAMSASEMRDLSLIVREAIGNAVKHGRAQHITLTSEAVVGADPRAARFVLRIANDGALYEAKKAKGVAEGHFGLEGMRERARRIGANLTIGVEGDQTVVTIAKPGKLET